MAWFKKERRAEEPPRLTPQVDDVLLQAMLGRNNITKKEALNIPSVRSCINFIADTVSMLPIKLYSEKNGKAEEIKDDNRVRLLNDDTGDTLDAVQFWKALITDYYLGKGGYAYMHKRKNEISGLYYVDEINVSINGNQDPIFKDYDILVNGNTYRPDEFVKLLRNSKDGAAGTGIIAENPLILSVAYNSLVYEENLVKKGGNKKGFVKSAKKLTDIAIAELKSAWKRLYSNNSDNVVVLNEGLEFQEASNTSVEMQLNENKEANAAEICKLFNIPINIIKGTATEAEYSNGFKMGIMPVLRAIECALNRDLLLEREKKSFYYAFDTKEMLKGDMKARYEAYGIGLDKNFLQPDEVRFMEDLPALGFKWIKLGLNDVLLDPKTGAVYTPNTDKTTKMTGDADALTDTNAAEGG